MPSQFTMATLPTPNNSAVALRECRQNRWPWPLLRLQYREPGSGRRQASAAWMQARNFTPAGPPQLARYNPPWTLPVWRRNEIHIEINP
ncbi:MAG: heme-binding protein [Burkholderiales bacterium]|nr:heme-binding protein [Burkholderiales bacterium]